MKQSDWNQGQGNNQRRSRSPWRNNAENRGGGQPKSPGRGDGPRNKDSLEKGGFQPQNERGREDTPLRNQDGEKEKRSPGSGGQRKCYKCGSIYHIARDCDDKDKKKGGAKQGGGFEKKSGKPPFQPTSGRGRGRGGTKVYNKSALTKPEEGYRQEDSGSEWSTADFSERESSGEESEADAKQCRAQSVHEELEVSNPKEQPTPLHQKADIRVMKIAGAVNALVFLDTGSHLNLRGQTWVKWFTADSKTQKFREMKVG